MSENGIEAVRTVTGDERHDMRLMTLLRSMVREKLLKGAAETLGVDPRTVQTSMERGELSDLVRVALERHVLADSDEKAAEQRERIDALERRLDALEMEIRSDPEDGRKAINEECQTFREEQVGASNQQAKSHPEGVDEDKGAPDENHAKENRGAGKATNAEGATRAPAPTTNEAQGPEYTVMGRRPHRVRFHDGWFWTTAVCHSRRDDGLAFRQRPDGNGIDVRCHTGGCSPELAADALGGHAGWPIQSA